MGQVPDLMAQRCQIRVAGSKGRAGAARSSSQSLALEDGVGACHSLGNASAIFSGRRGAFARILSIAAAVTIYFTGAICGLLYMLALPVPVARLASIVSEFHFGELKKSE